MKNLNYYKQQIKQKRKNTDFREFLKEIASWYPFAFYKQDGIITDFPRTDRMNKKVISSLEFEELRDGLVEKGLNYDFDKSFFENFRELFLSIPRYNLFSFHSQNADYADNVYNAKNVYLSNSVVHDCENIFYSFSVKMSCRNVFNSFMVWENSDNIYFCSGILKSYNVFYSKYILNSNNIWFSSNLNGCSECILCDGLENKSYCIKNKHYDKQEYLLKKQEILKNKPDFQNFYNSLNKTGNLLNSKASSGNFLLFCENVENGYFSYNVKDAKNIMLMGSENGNEEFYDCIGGGAPKGDRYYGCCFIGTYSQDLYLSNTITNSTNIFYSYYMEACSHCIGCVGLKNKSYCILNKQYTKEQWEELAPKIFETMEKDGTLGKFFPAKLNPFYFNDTVAGLISGFQKEEIVKEGFLWRDEKIRVDIPDESVVVGVDELDSFEGWRDSETSLQGQWYINPEILKKVIKNENGDYYRILKTEYDFLIKHSLPLSRLHWLDRIKLSLGM